MNEVEMTLDKRMGKNEKTNSQIDKKKNRYQKSI